MSTDRDMAGMTRAELEEEVRALRQRVRNGSASIAAYQRLTGSDYYGTFASKIANGQWVNHGRAQRVPDRSEVDRLMTLARADEEPMPFGRGAASPDWGVPVRVPEDGCVKDSLTAAPVPEDGAEGAEAFIGLASALNKAMPSDEPWRSYSTCSRCDAEFPTDESAAHVCDPAKVHPPRCPLCRRDFAPPAGEVRVPVEARDHDVRSGDA